MTCLGTQLVGRTVCRLGGAGGEFVRVVQPGPAVGGGAVHRHGVPDPRVRAQPRDGVADPGPDEQRLRAAVLEDVLQLVRTEELVDRGDVEIAVADRQAVRLAQPLGQDAVRALPALERALSARR